MTKATVTLVEKILGFHPLDASNPMLLLDKWLHQYEERQPYFWRARLKISKYLWPRGVVVSALTSHVRGAGFDSWPG